MKFYWYLPKQNGYLTSRIDGDLTKGTHTHKHSSQFIFFIARSCILKSQNRFVFLILSLLLLTWFLIYIPAVSLSQLMFGKRILKFPLIDVYIFLKETEGDCLPKDR